MAHSAHPAGLGGLHTYPGKQPQSVLAPYACGIFGDAGFSVGMGHVIAWVIVTVVSPPVMVTCSPGTICVTVPPGRVRVVVYVDVLPGTNEVTVLPPWVIVVENPGRLVVTTDVTVDPGAVTVGPGFVTVVPGAVTVGPVRVMLWVTRDTETLSEVETVVKVLVVNDVTVSVPRLVTMTG